LDSRLLAVLSVSSVQAAPGYSLVNVAANYTVNPYTTVFGRIDNLFNQHYQNPTGFERPGFGIYRGIRVAKR
jgi:vitamin B12 transporter